VQLESILDHLGIKIDRYEAVHGGDINESFCLYSGNEKFFLKVNDGKLYPRMFEKEARGLNALAIAMPALIIPQVVKNGDAGQYQYLVLQWVEKGRPKKDFWESFGRSLASMHLQAQDYFGLYEDNYIGSLPQRNMKHTQWHTFYADCRITPLVKTLFDNGSFSKSDLAVAESFCTQSQQWFPIEPPALLHGDLWGGNYMISSEGCAAVFDPAIYYGHREMDIGMTRLFGGFDQKFYDAYEEIYPMVPGWRQRLPLSQLYPLLVHAVLFGGHYVGSAREIIRQFSN
jgi:fructosamine-3-kinase